MALNSKVKYPSRRTYVVKVRSDAKPAALAGCLENLVTGQQHVFASGHELVDSIESDLQVSHDEAPADSKERRESRAPKPTEE